MRKRGEAKGARWKWQHPSVTPLGWELHVLRGRWGSYECRYIVCQGQSEQGRRTALEGFGKSCQLVTGPGNETASFPGPLNLQPCHLLGLLAFILHLPGPALLPVGPAATLQLFLYIWGQDRVLELLLGTGTPSCLPGFLRKICSLKVLRQARQGWDRYRRAVAWEGMRRMTPTGAGQRPATLSQQSTPGGQLK